MTILFVNFWCSEDPSLSCFLHNWYLCTEHVHTLQIGHHVICIHITLITAGSSSPTATTNTRSLSALTGRVTGVWWARMWTCFTLVEPAASLSPFPCFSIPVWNSTFFHGSLMTGLLCAASWCPLIRHNLATNLKHIKKWLENLLSGWIDALLGRTVLFPADRD